MFTGLVEEIGIVKSVTKSGTGANLTIECSEILSDIARGDSIAIDGVCQTVTLFDSKSFTVFFSQITSEVTTLGKLQPGDSVNLERAMTLNRRFGGHIVQGHVDGMGTIKSIKRDSSGVTFEITVKRDLLKYIVKKGSITTDGISLTLVDKKADSFSLYIIPETLENTSINNWKEGKAINIEVDILAKYVENLMVYNDSDENSKKDSKMKSLLLENGFFT